MELNQNELQEIRSVMDKWLVRKTDRITHDKLDLIYNYYKNTDFTSVIKTFSDRLKTVPWKFTKSEEVSGSVCFFGGVITSILNYGYIEEIEGLFTFAVCYMLIDHFLDNNQIPEGDKNKFIKEIYQFILTGVKNDNPMIQAVGDRYLELVRRVPKCKEYFIKLFISELEGYKVQQNKNLSREDYLKAAEEKGGLTSLCIASIIGLDTTENTSSFDSGRNIQLCDDILDLKDDVESNIYTLARYDLDHGGLDRYVYESVLKINELSPIYNVFKIILLLGLILGIHDNSNSVSDELNEIIQNYNVFIGTSKEKLIEWFHSKLSSYMEENDL